MERAELDDLAYIAGRGGPGLDPVLVVHSWWGLTGSFTSFADQLAARGLLVGCIDLYDGAIATTEREARALRATRREPAYKQLRRCLDELRARDEEGSTPSVVGFSMGGHWAVWLAQHPDPPVAAIVLYYAARGGDFSRATAPVLAHFASDDDFVSRAARRSMERAVAARGLEYVAHDYPATEHWFAESDARQFSAGAAQLAFDRTASFLARGFEPPAAGQS
ncbi:MAG: dienelactone hydrolase family protein [Acidimicrobiia bacterium]|nr:dienelactone hydrolase family protein [Acidimicrobiia bacterium]